MSPKIFTNDEIKMMVTDGLKIILVDNKLYDITIYYKSHPGGTRCFDNKVLKVINNTLIKHDCTYDFNFHSKNSHKIWKQLFIGLTHKKLNLFNFWGLFS